MNDLRDTLAGALDGLEKLATKIPGYSGYKEKELRREADKLLRDHLARQLNAERRRLLDVQNTLISAGMLDLIDDVDDLTTRLQTLADRVQHASYGYAGFFDAVKVKEEQLDALYNFDNAMVTRVDEIQAGIEALAQAIEQREKTALNQAIASLRDLLRELNDLFLQRKEAITGGLTSQESDLPSDPTSPQT